MKQRLLPDTDAPLSNGAVLPGPRGIRLLWTMGRLITDSLDPLDRLAETARTYGDLIRFGLGSQELILLNHPDYLRHVLVTHQDKYARTEVLHALRPLLGDGLFTSDSKKRSQNSNQGVILNSFQDLIGVVAFIGRFRHEAKPTDGVNKFGMTQGCFEIVS